MLDEILSALKNVGQSTADVGESIAKGTLMGIGDIPDFAGDVTADATDHIASIFGYHPDLMKQKGFLDKANDSYRKFLEGGDVVKSMGGGTDSGKKVLKGVEKVSEIAGPMVLGGGLAGTEKEASNYAKLMEKLKNHKPENFADLFTIPKSQADTLLDFGDLPSYLRK